MNSPLKAFSQITDQVLQLPPIPKLADEIRNTNFKDGISSFDAKMEIWRQSVERLIKQQFSNLEQKIPKSGLG